MDKESGVYLTIKDNSFQSGGTSSLKTIITMLTTKGKLGMNYVTADTFKNVLGYDLDYNSNYYGLSKILEKVQYAYVWRLNQNAKLANLYFMSGDETKQSDEDIETFEDILNKDPSPIIAIANTDVGNPGTNTIKFAPTPDVITVANENPAGSNPQEIIVEDCRESEETVFNGETIKSACIFYDSSNTSVVGVIKENPEGELKLYKVVDGEILQDEITIDEFNIWSDGTNFYNSMMIQTTEPEGEAQTPVELGDVTSNNYDVLTDAWTLQGTTYNATKTQITPVGSKGQDVSIADVYIADNTATHLSSGTWYATDDGSNTFYVINELGKTWAETDKTQIDSSETDIIDELNAIYVAGDFGALVYNLYTDTRYTGMYQKKENNEWFKVTSFATNMIATKPSSETDTDIINALEDSSATTVTISYIKYIHEYTSKVNAIGDVNWQGSRLNLVLYASFSKDSYWNIRTIPTEIKNWTLYVGEYKDNQYTIKSTNYISIDTESPIYWKNVVINDIQIDIKSIPAGWASLREWQTLDNGSNGDQNIVATDIDVTPLETSPCNVLVTNGITNYRIINRIAAKAQEKFIHTFADAPAFASYIDLENWKKNIYRSEYLAIGSRPDEVLISEDQSILVYPSVNYVAILSNMIEQQGSLCYPPAGLTYGNIEVESLIECDYEKYGDELKTNRINWQRNISRGPVMWEQRTTYALDTDLSYIAPVFIVDDVRDQIITLEEQFTFRYTTPTDLLNQESELTNILEGFLTKGLLYSYTLNVPTFQEAQKAGRTLEIPISIVITKDAEVINIILTLNNAQ